MIVDVVEDAEQIVSLLAIARPRLTGHQRALGNLWVVEKVPSCENEIANRPPTLAHPNSCHEKQ